MSTPTQVYNNQVDQSVANGTISSDQAKAKKENLWVRFLLWIAEMAPIITAGTAICYSMQYFIGTDPIDLIESSAFKLILNVIIVFSAIVTILLSFFMDIMLSLTAQIVTMA
jgi:hypothetical protein